MISPDVFLIFLKFSFFGLLGGERAKKCPKWKITVTSVTCHMTKMAQDDKKNLSAAVDISGTIYHMIVIYDALA